MFRSDAKAEGQKVVVGGLKVPSGPVTLDGSPWSCRLLRPPGSAREWRFQGHLGFGAALDVALPRGLRRAWPRRFGFRLPFGFSGDSEWHKSDQTQFVVMSAVVCWPCKNKKLVSDEFGSLVSNVRENPCHDSENEQIRILLEKQREHIQRECEAERFRNTSPRPMMTEVLKCQMMLSSLNEEKSIVLMHVMNNFDEIIGIFMNNY